MIKINIFYFRGSFLEKRSLKGILFLKYNEKKLYLHKVF